MSPSKKTEPQTPSRRDSMNPSKPASPILPHGLPLPQDRPGVQWAQIQPHTEERQERPIHLKIIGPCPVEPHHPGFMWKLPNWQQTETKLPREELVSPLEGRRYRLKLNPPKKQPRAVERKKGKGKARKERKRPKLVLRLRLTPLPRPRLVLRLPPPPPPHTPQNRYARFVGDGARNAVREREFRRKARLRRTPCDGKERMRREGDGDDRMEE